MSRRPSLGGTWHLLEGTVPQGPKYPSTRIWGVCIYIYTHMVSILGNVIMVLGTSSVFRILGPSGSRLQQTWNMDVGLSMLVFLLAVVWFGGRPCSKFLAPTVVA